MLCSNRLQLSANFKALNYSQSQKGRLIPRRWLICHCGNAKDVVKVTFKLKKQVPFKTYFRVCGSVQELGAWDLDSAPCMTWSEGHVWSLEVLTQSGRTFEYKVVKVPRREPLRWEKGRNRVLTVPDCEVQVGLVFDKVDEADLVTVREPTEPRESPPPAPPRGSVDVGRARDCEGVHATAHRGAAVVSATAAAAAPPAELTAWDVAEVAGLIPAVDERAAQERGGGGGAVVAATSVEDGDKVGLVGFLARILGLGGRRDADHQPRDEKADGPGAAM